MLFPTKDEIIDAVADNSNLLPLALRGYQCTMGRFGPLYYPGGFCIVFKLYNKSRYKALRVWYAEVEDLTNRIKALSGYFSKNKYSFIVPFTFHEQALRVPTRDGNSFLNIMIMDWVEGVDIKQFIKKTLFSSISAVKKKEKLFNLATKLVNIFMIMHNAGMSHGDLQHTNIIILPNGDPILIDYDSMYYPGTRFRKHITNGYDEYQHPARKKSKEANEKTDYFSELIICLSLLAHGEDETIWKRYSIDNLDYSMLLSKEDLLNINSSPLFKELSCKSESLQMLSNILKDYLGKMDIDRLEPFISYNSVSSIFNIYGKYCIGCGKEFTSIEDLFCTHCGIKRV